MKDKEKKSNVKYYVLLIIAVILITAITATGLFVNKVSSADAYLNKTLSTEATDYLTAVSNEMTCTPLEVAGIDKTQFANTGELVSTNFQKFLDSLNIFQKINLYNEWNSGVVNDYFKEFNTTMTDFSEAGSAVQNATIKATAKLVDASLKSSGYCTIEAE